MSLLDSLTHLSDLTLALAAAGGVVLAGVIAHGAWQARRAGPKRADTPSPLDSPAGSTELVEPVFGDEPPRVTSAADAHDESTESPTRLDEDAARAEPVGMAAAAPAASLGATTVAKTGAIAAAAPLLPPRRAAAGRAPARIDALIDAIATLSLDAPVSGDALLPQLPPSRRAGTKLLLVEGLNVDSDAWEPPRTGQRYRELQAAVQLANRSGALNEIEYSEFVQKVQALADALGAAADFPDMLEAVARARELDAFAGAHDAQLAVHLQARAAAWSLGYLQQHAARHGFVAGALPGRLVMPGSADGAPPTLTLGYDAQAALADDPNQAALRDITLGFDVPQTDPAVQPFTTWQASAQALAASMDAVLIDDAGRPLSPTAFETIGAELQRLYDALAAHELAAGSTAARRLFS